MREKNLSKSKLPLRGIEALNNANLNQGTGFTQKEWKDLGLVGLLPTGALSTLRRWSNPTWPPNEKVMLQ
jgi:hypothetical protein